MEYVFVTMLMMLAFCSGVQAERPFFTFDNGLTDIKDVEEQAKLLKDLGYAGICTRPKNATDAMIAAFDKHGVQIMATYVVLSVEASKTEVPEEIVTHFKKLKGRQTVVWLSLNNSKAPIESAVELTRNVCDKAAENGLNVVFYPHVGCLTERIPTCMKILKAAGRKNLGLSFTLCHFLAQNDHRGIESMLKEMGTDLKLVLINGANELPAPKADWKALIQPLGKGTLDVGRVIKTLDEIGYDGPVGLQCYQVPGPAQEHLKASMEAWRRLSANKESNAPHP